MMQYGAEQLNVERFTVKIGFDNTASIKLFDSFGFKEVSRSEIFQEMTMLLPVKDSDISAQWAKIGAVQDKYEDKS